MDMLYRLATQQPIGSTRTWELGNAAINRLLHEPTIRLRSLDGGSSHGRLALLRELFGLERSDDDDDDTGNVRSLGR